MIINGLSEFVTDYIYRKVHLRNIPFLKLAIV